MNTVKQMDSPKRKTQASQKLDVKNAHSNSVYIQSDSKNKPPFQQIDKVDKSMTGLRRAAYT